jgi:hypothetical protein
MAAAPRLLAFLGEFDGSCTIRLERSSDRSPIGTLIKKTHRHEKLSVIHPPSGGPMAGAVTIAML